MAFRLERERTGSTQYVLIGEPVKIMTYLSKQAKIFVRMLKI